MASIQKQFDKYALYYYTDSNVYIICSYGGKNVGFINFVKENVSIPKNSVKDDILRIYFSVARFNDIISILRLEKPLYLWLYDSGTGSISTSSEPVGEQESEKTA
jgi:hypothetical protein